MKVSATTDSPVVETLKPAQQSRRTAIKPGRIMIYVLLVLGAIVFILPFMWMVTTSLKPSQQVFTFPPQFFPSTFQWQNYIDGWTTLPFTHFLINTIIVTVANVFGNLISCALPAYGFARLRARGSNVMFVLMLATMMIPAEVTLVPTFILFSKVGLVNTLWPLILPAWFGYPFSIFLLRQFFMSIPNELDDAARIEGASNLRILTSIILPLSKPALATVAIFAFVGNWNNLLSALIYLRSTNQFTLAIGLNLFYGQSVTAYNQLMAVSILTILPIIVTFFFSQKYFIRGVVLSMGER
ncbi:carbohydrate ABC transporter permease [Dictyobacter aurantiacus]|uniref:Sugar ABC transporter permease n=1 Tax=Dictyobacter aurantiacus TaxID=1936993 RepID=A0A401ZLE5_9CHLR|nr:carbohydrate ABC transporter permease [Dictyobacter aurantiacus]GCE07666.1 sugar ABC transporter permease [Dictyobacter aurantiacus]